MQIPFIKMNGAGNDFVVIDARQQSMVLSFEQVRAIASRTNPVTKGCDQVIVMEPSAAADVFMRIYNANGGEVDACGNATRCIAHFLEKELGRVQVSIQTNVALLHAVKKVAHEGQEYTLVDMGMPGVEWHDIPLAIKVDTLRVPLETGLIGATEACCVSMGNPHAIFFMDTLPSDEEVARVGYALEHHHAIFPEGVNVTFAAPPVPVIGSDDAVMIDVKIWERGAGMTKACGTGACATLVAAIRRGLTGGRRSGMIWFNTHAQREQMAMLSVEWREDGHVLLGGLVAVEFEGILHV